MDTRGALGVWRGRRVEVVGAWSPVMNRGQRGAGFFARHGGMRLAKVVWQVGMNYQAAAQGVKSLAETLADDPERKRLVAKLKGELSTI